MNETTSPYGDAVDRLVDAALGVRDAIGQELIPIAKAVYEIEHFEGCKASHFPDLGDLAGAEESWLERWTLNFDLVETAEHDGATALRRILEFVNVVEDSEFFCFERIKLGRALAGVDDVERAIREAADAAGVRLDVDAPRQRRTTWSTAGKSSRSRAESSDGDTAPQSRRSTQQSWGGGKFDAEPESVRHAPASNHTGLSAEEDLFVREASLVFPCPCDQLKKAHRRLSLKFHPDVNSKDNEESQMMSRINVGYDRLRAKLRC